MSNNVCEPICLSITESQDDASQVLRQWKRDEYDQRPILQLCVYAEAIRGVMGALTNLSDGTEYLCKDLSDCILRANCIYERIDRPQACVQMRSFHTSTHQVDPPAEKDRLRQRRRRALRLPEAGRKNTRATFLIHTIFRQNASMQGELVWFDKQLRRNFRSALELMYLINDALEISE